MDLVEEIGSGIKRIRDLCRDYGVAEPKIEVAEHGVTITFLRATDPVTLQVTPQVTQQVTGQAMTQPTQSPTRSDPVRRLPLSPSGIV